MDENKTDETIPKPRPNQYTVVCALLASVTSVLLGYDIGAMSGASILIKEDMKITYGEQEILVGVLNVFSLFGSLASGKMSDCIGRRYTIVFAAFTFLLGALLMGLAPNYWFLLVGRMVAGVGVGYALMIAPLYTAEISPAMSRGLLTSLPEVFIVFGILIGYIINYFLATLPLHLGWRIMLGIAAVPAIAIAISVVFMPESPRWLVMKGKIPSAKKVLLKTSRSPEEAEERLQEISTSTAAIAADQGNRNIVWKELLVRPTPAVRRMLLTAIGMNFFMQASGNDAVVYYCPEVFRAAGISNKKHLFGVNVIMGLSKTFFVLVSAFRLDKFGRRPLLLIGSSGMAVSLAGLGLGSLVLYKSAEKPLWAIILSVVAVCADVSFFSIGLGPITWVYSSEIFPTRIRAQGSSLAISVNRLVSGVVAMTFLSISKKITFGGMFFVLCGIMVMGTVFFYAFIPETKGKSLEELETLFEKNPKGKGDEQGTQMAAV
ncbi:hypothetical protein QN277_000673 [Acacia crassicarpa]|uniref:Major facilitator superfamily (MFS) profile domain-containing protein n=1 Tax=Acacia crassicarpa TaxID=499986 RepID=A0AAE1N5N8_9FABA|nr:hypothetical protein QN277_000673 [Acacia crassicarpa]